MKIEDLRQFMQINVDATATEFTNDISSFIGLLKSTGVSDSEIKTILATDLAESGRIFGRFKNNSRSIVRNGVESASNIASEQTFTDAGVTRWRWVTSGKNVCPNCENRSGVIGTLEYFNTIGREKSGFSVCGQNCQCQLVPLEYEVEGDLIRKKPKKKPKSKDNPVGFAKTKAEAIRWATTNQALGKKYFDNTTARFGGRGVDNYGNFNRYKSLSLEQANEVNRLLNETNEYADKIGVPRIRGLAVARGRSLANMGDGVMGINKTMFTRAKWKVEKARNQIKNGEQPWSVTAYFDDSDTPRFVEQTIFHEFGHQIHQQKGVTTQKEYLGGKLRSSTPMEGRIRVFNQKMQKDLLEFRQKNNFGRTPADRKKVALYKRTIFPSEYSMTNSNEWFAETFSLWKMGRGDLLHPKIIEFFEEEGLI